MRVSTFTVLAMAAAIVSPAMAVNYVQEPHFHAHRPEHTAGHHALAHAAHSPLVHTTHVPGAGIAHDLKGNRAEELARRSKQTGGTSEHDAHVVHTGGRGHDRRAADLERRKVNWKGLEHDVPAAWHAGARIAHDIKGKRADSEELARRSKQTGGTSEHDAHVVHTGGRGHGRREADLERRKVNWKGLKHDVPSAYRTGVRLWHDVKGKREEELVMRKVNWKGLEHDAPAAWHAGAKLAHDF